MTSIDKKAASISESKEMENITTPEIESQTELDAKSAKNKAKKAETTAKQTDVIIEKEVNSDVEKNNSVQLGIFKLSSEVVIPQFQTDQSACFDLSGFFEIGEKIKHVSQSQMETVRRATDRGIAIMPNERFLIPTGLVFDIPQGYCLQIYPRSGTSYKLGLSLNNCTAIIDSDYVEQVYISVNNNSGSPQYIKTGERIAQAKLVKLVDTQISTLDSKPTQKTNRSGGFGSTGSK